MNKVFLLICLIGLISLIGKPVFAAATPSAISSPSATKAQDLLNRVATKVAQLSNKMQRTYRGSVKSASAATYVVTTSEGEKNITTNNATDFFRIKAGKRSTINFDGIKAGDDIVSIGTIDSQTTDMTARQVIAKIHRFNFPGTITAIDKDLVTITLTDNSQVKADLENALTLKKIVNDKILTAKLADFVVGNTIFVIAYSPDPKTGDYSSLKALVINK